MNFDVIAPTTPSLARRLRLLSKFFPIEITPKILQRCHEDILSLSTVRENVPEQLHEWLTDEVLELCQHAMDHNYRFILGATKKAQPLTLSLIAALANGENVVIIDEEKRGKGKRVLLSHNIDFTEDTQSDARIIYTTVHECPEEDLNRLRKRVAINVGMNNDNTFWFGSGVEEGISFMNLPMEFPKFIHAYDSNSIPDVFKDYRMLGIIHEMYPNVPTGYIEGTGRLSEASQFTGGQLARMLGIHLRFTKEKYT